MILVSPINIVTFIGMDIEFKKDRTITLVIKEYLKENINIFGEEISGKAPTPANGKLFEVNKSRRLNDKKRSVSSHSGKVDVYI